MRPIDADKLIAEIIETGNEAKDAHIFFDKQAVIDMINEQPTVTGDSPGK